MEDIVIPLILSGKPKQYPEYTSLLACALEPTYFASSYQTNPPRWFISVEVVNLFTKQLSQGEHSIASIFFKVFSIPVGFMDSYTLLGSSIL
jgi:hypothetical protein